MKEFIELREAELKADLEKIATQLADLQATAQRIQGALLMLGELKAKQTES